MEGAPDISKSDAARLTSEEAKKHGGVIPEGSIARKAQRSVARREMAAREQHAASRRQGIEEEPIRTEDATIAAGNDKLHELLDSGRLPTREDAAEVQAQYAAAGLPNWHNSAASRVQSAAAKAEMGMQQAMAEGGFTRESARLLQSAEAKLHGGRVPHGGVSARIAHEVAEAENEIKKEEGLPTNIT